MFSNILNAKTPQIFVYAKMRSEELLQCNAKASLFYLQTITHLIKGTTRLNKSLANNFVKLMML